MIRTQLLTPPSESAYSGNAIAGSPTPNARETKLNGFAESGYRRPDRRNDCATRFRSLSAADRIGYAPDHPIGHTAVSRVVGEPTKRR